MSNKILINNQYSAFSLTRKKKEKVKNIINKIVKDYGYTINMIVINFITDNELLEINKKFLNHDYYTDIITFDYTEEKKISSDIFISIDRVRENAIKYKQNLENELFRVIFHGILHLCGLKDKKVKEKKMMKEKEDYYLNLYFLSN